MEKETVTNRPNTRSRRKNEDRLNNYKQKFWWMGLTFTLGPRIQTFPSFCCIKCVLGECKDYPGYDKPCEGEEINNNNDHISIYWYDTLPSCSILRMLPKYPPEVEVIKRVQTKVRAPCAVLFMADAIFVCGIFKGKNI